MRRATRTFAWVLAAGLAVAGLFERSVATAQRGPEGVRVEGVAALVGGTAPGAGTLAVLRSDVTLRARIAVSARAARLPTGRLPPDLLAAVLDEIIGEVLIAREADRLRAARPSDEEVAAQRHRIEEQAGGAERLAALLRAVDASGDEIDAIARRRAYVEAFLRANLEGSTVISDAQVQRAYEAGEHPFVGRELEEIREPLRAWVAAQTLQRDVRRWIEVLRGRTTVRVVAEWSANDGTGN